MQQNLSEQMLKGILEMLFEFGKGNTSFRIPRINRDHFTDEVIVIVNLAAEKLQANIETSHHEFLQHYIRVSTVITDPEFTIIDHSWNFENVIRYYGLSGEYLIDFITGHNPLPKARRKLMLQKEDSVVVFLDFGWLNDQIPAFCTVSMLKGGNLAVNAITLHSDERFVLPILSADQKRYWEANPEEAQLIMNIREYIESGDGREEDYEIKALGKKFHIRIIRIKKGFYALYGIYFSDFYRQARLKKAQKLILETDMPIKSISHEAGFKLYRTFYSAFVKYFGITPTGMRFRKENDL
ncbi:hypothetical protein FNO01nite_05150 [Flavobacterium noncentrifugens]|uniref:AraC-type DNA-binding protein n=1 Tax=Flavobacterium noncentrifugens TaxID=1128970 RepID=A0A1G8SI80_9FLAO|nr:helix-turn-helix domain-containing protein [Flavobacterium noncentrifugens]GEP49843.1 hypothetical protein FNO01nite_05150 [Flavobacterium noncentrifugens]SDJ28948.1 AraC-type DNA-binding protein [Flavobacterium noncentrifugens]